MCILMMIHQGVAGYPIVLAANRDEYYDRPSAGPQLLQQIPRVWGGRDVRAGGTWLGINAHGLVVGLTNRRLCHEQKTDPHRRSRGLLCLEALQYQKAAEAVEFLASEPPDRYNACNLLLADPEEIFWTAYDGKPETRRLSPGLYILANGNLNDLETVRIRRARQLLQSSQHIQLDRLLPLLEQVCRDHEAGVQDRDTICMHRKDEQYGTVSSTIMALAPTLHDSIYRYTERHPCCQPYQDCSSLFIA
jgi:uncharacterized protein with NRDE domain